MKVWPIDPLVPRNLRLEVPEKVTGLTRSREQGKGRFSNPDIRTTANKLQGCLTHPELFVFLH